MRREAWHWVIAGGGLYLGCLLGLLLHPALAWLGGLFLGGALFWRGIQLMDTAAAGSAEQEAGTSSSLPWSLRSSYLTGTAIACFATLLLRYGLLLWGARAGLAPTRAPLWGLALVTLTDVVAGLVLAAGALLGPLGGLAAGSFAFTLWVFFDQALFDIPAERFGPAFSAFVQAERSWGRGLAALSILGMPALVGVLSRRFSPVVAVLIGAGVWVLMRALRSLAVMLVSGRGVVAAPLPLAWDAAIIALVALVLVRIDWPRVRAYRPW
jgi:hypothetical protein